MKVYFDACSLHRILDDRSQPRVAVEGEAMLNMLTLVEPGELKLVSSAILDLEVSKCNHARRRDYVEEILGLALDYIALNATIQLRASALVTAGFKTYDALHLASAEAATNVSFCTCDDRLLKKSRRQSDLKIRVFSILELAEEVLP